MTESDECPSVDQKLEALRAAAIRCKAILKDAGAITGCLLYACEDPGDDEAGLTGRSMHYFGGRLACIGLLTLELKALTALTRELEDSDD